MPGLLRLPTSESARKPAHPRRPLRVPGWERGWSGPRPRGWATYAFAVRETLPRLVLWAPKCICMHLSVQRSANGKQKPAPFC